MFKRKSFDAQVGDKFVKANDNKNTVWVVEKIFEHVDGIMHARLYNRAHPKTMITISALTLCDPDFFCRAPTDSED